MAIQVVCYIALLVVWHVAATVIDIALLMPTPQSTLEAFVDCLMDAKVMENVFITLFRVVKGWLMALAIGVPVGMLMGLSPIFEKVLGGIVNSVRQVPMMAWVPLAIIWLGIGDGPTLFMIALNGVFPVIMNTSAGVLNISSDYYHAAKSMGADKKSIFFHVIIPAALPDILVGARLAIGAGWMSVICAEFIATSAGIGYEMVEAQTMMKTNVLLALMFMSAIIGLLIDRTLQFANRVLTKWRYTE